MGLKLLRLAVVLWIAVSVVLCIYAASTWYVLCCITGSSRWSDNSVSGVAGQPVLVLGIGAICLLVGIVVLRLSSRDRS